MTERLGDCCMLSKSAQGFDEPSKELELLRSAKQDDGGSKT